MARSNPSINSGLILRRWLLLRLGRGGPNGSRLFNSEEDSGYIIVAALVAFVILLIGSVAFAGRTYSSFFGAVNQSANQEARDVAESAISEFQGTFNKLENRGLLVSGTAAWDSILDRNRCTGTTIDSNGIPTAGFKNPDAVDMARFTPGGTSFQNLDKSSASSSSRQKFRVESIEYLDGSRELYTSRTAPSAVAIKNGSSRGLIRVTVLGVAERNGVKSQARVTREFEVVPKCCDRSFGRNTYGGVNWGRDARACYINETTQGAGNGIIGANTGGALSGTNKVSITDEFGNKVNTAICYGGPSTDPNDPTSDLTGSPSQDCLDGKATVGSTSFVPTTYNLDVPDFCALTTGTYQCPEADLTNSTHDADADISLAIGSGAKGKYVYYDTKDKKVKKCDLTSSLTLVAGSCTDLNGSGPDPCYMTTVSSDTSYYVNRVSCRVNRFTGLNGADPVYFDTTAARIDFFFDQDRSVTGEYMPGGGSTQYRHVNCQNNAEFGKTELTSNYSAGTPLCLTVVQGKPEQTPNFFEECKDYPNSPGCPQKWNLGERLNIYTLGSGNFTINGTASTAAFNLYAPKASVTILGGGKADPNFLGRIWADDITFNGNVKVIANSANADFCYNEDGSSNGRCPDPLGKRLFDFIVRSFSQAGGYGLN